MDEPTNRLNTSSAWRETIRSERLPLAFVDLDAFDRNVKKLEELTPAGKTIRIASKSLRVPELMERALSSSQRFQGLMCYSAEEAFWLAGLGFNHLMLAYPTFQNSDLEAVMDLHAQGKWVSLMVDSVEGIRLLGKKLSAEKILKAGMPLPVMIDLDLSLRLLGGLLHLGVRRSPIRSAHQAIELIAEIQQFPQFKFTGLMGYEAQVAGLGDQSPFKSYMNPIARVIRYFSIQHMAFMRQSFADRAKELSISYDIFNGGGTGSFNLAAQEACLTELTAGSGLLTSHLFDYYSNIRFEPALYFALQVVRRSDANLVTLQGGGYVSSGAPGWDKVPLPVVPQGLHLVSTEGCGEVQTPVFCGNIESLALGDSVLFRPAKAGELAERFDHYYFISNGKIVRKAKTYRGYGKCFF